MTDLPFDQVVTALRNWSQGIPDIRARYPGALAARVLDHIDTLTRETLLTPEMAEAIAAAKEMADVIYQPKADSYRDFRKASDRLGEAVRALRALEGA
jgi:hypothetical protein